MRRHLTTLRWYEDRLCSLSCRWLISLTIASLFGIAGLGLWVLQFIDDLVFLVGDSDVRMLATLAGILLLMSIGLWLLSVCMVALGRRLVLYVKGL